MNGQAKIAIVLLAVLPGFVFCPTKVALGASTNAEELLKLAAKEGLELTDAERKLFEAVADGKEFNPSHKQLGEIDPRKAADWGEDRILRADRLAWLFERKAAQLVTKYGVRISGARIDAQLDLFRVNVSFGLQCHKCAIAKGLDLRDGQIQSLSLSGTYSGKLDATGMRVKGDVHLDEGFNAEGEVRLSGATIGGVLRCRRGQFSNSDGDALSSDSAQITGDVYLDEGFKAEGEVRLSGATIGGVLRCRGGQFNNSDGVALYLDRAQITGDVYLTTGFKAEGAVRLVGAKIGGQFAGSGGQFRNSDGDALFFDRAQISGSVLLTERFEAVGQVRLVGAKIGGQFACRDGHFRNSDGNALRFDDAQISGGVILDGDFRAEGEVRLSGATIGGQFGCRGGQFINSDGDALSFERAQITGSIDLTEGFKAEGQVRLGGAKIGGVLSCGGGQFINSDGNALSFDGAEITASVFLTKGFEAEGEVRLLGATIDGQFVCHGGQFSNADGNALSFDSAQITRDVFLSQGFNAEGDVRLPGAKIGGQFACRGGRFINADGNALSFDNAQIAGSVLLDENFKAEGEVRLLGATIGGQLDCSGGQFSNSDGNALNLDRAQITGDVVLDGGFMAVGTVSIRSAKINEAFVSGDSSADKLDLRNAEIGLLQDERNSWPTNGQLLLDGLVYDQIADSSPLAVESRKVWLALQSDDRFRSQPYEQLAKVLSASGHFDAAKDILIEKEHERVRFSQVSQGERILWYWTFGPLIGYGHYPLRALSGVIVVVLLGTLIFGLGTRGSPTTQIMTPTDKEGYNETGELADRYPRLNTLVYSLDAFAPLIDLYQVKYWLPSASRGRTLLRLGSFTLQSGCLLRAYLWLHTIFGWTLTAVLAAGLTGLVRG
jgi:hypothetical protein